MLGLLVLAFLVVPLIELFVLIRVGAAIGALNTVALLFLVSVVGGWLMKQQGLGVVQRVRLSLAAGRVPGAEVVDGFLILLGGALMLTPGFVTDGVGLALLLPPVRAGLRRLVRRRVAVKVLGTNRPDGVIDL